jgi:septum site-determining protein MinC
MGLKRDEVLFRGTREGLQVIIDDEADFETIKTRLAERLQSAEYFFRGGDVVLDTGKRMLTEEQLLTLEDISRKHRMRLTKVVSHTRRARGADPVLEAEVAPVTGPPTDTLLHRRTLRSGQSLEFAGNVVVLGDVNPGAEIRAGGDIIVMGALRGVAHAGAGGYGDAVVVALRLRPTQLRIGSCIGRPPDEEAVTTGAPEIARIRDGAIIIENLAHAT